MTFSDSSEDDEVDDIAGESWRQFQSELLAIDEFPPQLRALPLPPSSYALDMAPRSGPQKLRAMDPPVENVHESIEQHEFISPDNLLASQPELATGTLVYRRPPMAEIHGALCQRVIDHKWILYQDVGRTLEDADSGPKRVFDEPLGELQFESNFESGNLAAVIRINEGLYDLVLDEDINGFGSTQWFFFLVSNMVPGQAVTFRIINLGKSTSLYEHGQRPLMFCENDKRLRHRRPEDPPWEKHPSEGWRQCGEEVAYVCSEMHKGELHQLLPSTLEVGQNVARLKEEPDNPRSRRGQMLYMMQFKITFDNNGPTYFATAHPYTYTRLQRVLTAIGEDCNRRPHTQRSFLCRTLGGNIVDLITITDRTSKSPKKSIVITARVHPGETNSSFVVERILDFLTSEHSQAQAFRHHFIFKVVPFLNPDGVINGNYRANLLGMDLNRRWRCASKSIHPEIWHTKFMMHRLRKEGGIALYIDLHGHSRKLDWFVYGCRTADTGSLTAKDPLILPSALRMEHSLFNMKNCSFTVKNCKDETARVTVWSEMKVNSAYTIEISLAGTSFPNEADKTDAEKPRVLRHFQVDDYFSIGQAICSAFSYHIDMSRTSSSAKAMKPLWDAELKKEEEVKTNIFEGLSEDIKVELQKCLQAEHVPDSESDADLGDDGIAQGKRRRQKKKRLKNKSPAHRIPSCTIRKSQSCPTVCKSSMKHPSQVVEISLAHEFDPNFSKTCMDEYGQREPEAKVESRCAIPQQQIEFPYRFSSGVPVNKRSRTSYAFYIKLCEKNKEREFGTVNQFPTKKDEPPLVGTAMCIPTTSPSRMTKSIPDVRRCTASKEPPSYVVKANAAKKYPRWHGPAKDDSYRRWVGNKAGEITRSTSEPTIGRARNTLRVSRTPSKGERPSTKKPETCRVASVTPIIVLQTGNYTGHHLARYHEV